MAQEAFKKCTLEKGWVGDRGGASGGYSDRRPCSQGSCLHWGRLMGR